MVLADFYASKVLGGSFPFGAPEAQRAAQGAAHLHRPGAHRGLPGGAPRHVRVGLGRGHFVVGPLASDADGLENGGPRVPEGLRRHAEGGGAVPGIQLGVGGDVSGSWRFLGGFSMRLWQF